MNVTDILCQRAVSSYVSGPVVLHWAQPLQPLSAGEQSFPGFRIGENAMRPDTGNVGREPTREEVERMRGPVLLEFGAGW
jgi:hypothetical protein